MLYQQENVRVEQLKQNEVFYTQDDGEMYQMTRRGAKSLDGYGDIVHLDKTEQVTLSYDDTIQRKRIELTLELVRRLVDSGFVFFSSVLVKADTYKNVLYHIEAIEAWDDAMFFHMPGRSLLLAVRLHYRRLGGSDGESMDWQFRLVAKGLPFEEQFKIAQQVGTPMKKVPRDNYGWGYDDIPEVPLFKRDVAVDRFTKTGSAAWFEGRSRVIEVRYDQYKVGMPLDPIAAHDSIMSLVNAALPFIGFGPLAEMNVSWMAPTYTFPNCEPEFWKQFNTAYLRKVVRRPLGLESREQV